MAAAHAFSKTLLLVEDDAIVAMATTRRLNSFGYAVITAGSGEAAVERVRICPAIDLVLMDINLGDGMDGTQAAQIILQERDIPVVFLSAHTNPEVVEKTEKITSYGYIVKGSGETMLLAAIKMAFRLYEARQNEKEQMRTSQERYRRISALTSDIAYSCVQLAGGSYQIDWLSGAVESITGYTVDELMAFGCWGCLVIDEDFPLFEQFVTRLAPNKKGKCELRIRSKDGMIRWLLCETENVAETHTAEALLSENLPPAVHRLYGGLVDITERKQAEAELEQFFDNAIELLCVADTSGHFVRVNREWERVLGYSLAELNGARFLDLVHPDDLPATLAAIVTLSEQKPVMRFSNRYRGKDGAYRWLEWHSAPWGERILATAQDITERKRAEVALALALKEKSTLLSDLQHRIKNSLTLIASLISLEQGQAVQPETQAALANLANRVNSLANLYTILYESKNMQEVWLDVYLEKVAQGLMQSYLGATAGLTLEVAWDEVRVDVRQATSLGLILNELMTNAFKHAFPGGGPGNLWVHLHCQEEEIELEVANDGQPLPPSFSLENAPGLGLQIVQVIAAQIKGKLTYRQAERTTFLVQVPL